MEKIICPHCKEPIYSGPSNCPICGKDLKTGSLQSKKKPQTYTQPPRQSKGSLVEYRRTCQVCGKIWHSLASREEQIISNQKNDALMAVGGGLQSCGTCGTCGSGTQTQATRNLNANQSDLQRLRSCPECSSANYIEQIIDHAK